MSSHKDDTPSRDGYVVGGLRGRGASSTLSPVGSAMSRETLPQATAACHFSVSVQLLGYLDVNLFCVSVDTTWPFSGSTYSLL